MKLAVFVAVAVAAVLAVSSLATADVDTEIKELRDEVAQWKRSGWKEGLHTPFHLSFTKSLKEGSVSVLRKLEKEVVDVVDEVRLGLERSLADPRPHKKIRNYSPREASSAAKNDGGYYDFIPVFHGAVFPQKTMSWSAKCFQHNTATLHVDDEGARLEIKASDPVDLLCGDLYLFMTAEGVYVKDVFIHGDHTLHIFKWHKYELEDVEYNGLRVFTIPDGLLGSLKDIWDTLSIFIAPEKILPENNLKFLKDKMNVTMPERPVNVIDLKEEDVMDGDQLAILRLDGLDPMVMYGSGSRTGHTAVALRLNGELHILESTAADPFGKVYWPPPYGIIKTPYKQWIKQAIAAEYNVALLRLSPEVRKNFNSQKAVDFFNSVEGLPYGFHNFVYGWIDTEEDNLPPPFTSQLLAIGLSLADRFIPANISTIFIDGLNMRFKHYLNIPETCNDMECVFEVCEKYNTTLAELMTYPEQDAWKYSDGYSMVCDVFVLELYKAAGVFGELANKLQGTEFTPRDVYMLDIYEKNWDRPVPCKVDKTIPYCQILGKYLLELEGYNTVTPYAHMNEHCESLPTKYSRIPPGC